MQLSPRAGTDVPWWAANVRYPADELLDAACDAAGGRTMWLGRKARVEGQCRFHVYARASMLTASAWNAVLGPWDRSGSLRSCSGPCRSLPTLMACVLYPVQSPCLALYLQEGRQVGNITTTQEGSP